MQNIKKRILWFFTYCLFLSFFSVFKEIRILRRLLSFQGRTTFIKRQIYIYCKWLIQFAHINTCTCFNVTLAIYRYLYTLDDRTVSLLSLRINISKHKIYCLLFFWIGINTCHDVLFYVMNMTSNSQIAHWWYPYICLSRLHDDFFISNVCIIRVCNQALVITEYF